jgi:hypothetical protein
MNIRILIGGADYTGRAVLEATRISYDSSRRVTTASVTFIGPAVADDATTAVYDSAVYDDSYYAFTIDYLAKVTIFDATGAGTTKLFEGSVLTQTMKQTDSVEGSRILYQCDCNDYAAWLDRSVAADIAPVPMPSSDQYLIQRLVGDFCAQVDATQHVDQLAASIYSYQWQNKTCRQILDDICAMTGGQWYVDFDGVLWYGAILGATQAPYGLSTSPDMVSTFPVRVDSWRKDFSNPINSAYVRGAAVADGFPWTQGSYQDPVSIKKYGTLGQSLVDTQLTSSYDCQLRAQTMVMQYSEPVEQGSFVVWTDGLALGQTVHIREDNLGIDDDYIIRAVAMAWRDPSLVEYSIQFGAKQPDLESFLRLLDQRTRWASALVPAAIPAAGSVTDASIASGGLSASSINSVNASAINGTITASQIGAVNASVIQGAIQASQIGSVNAPAIQGAITAGQIGSVNATTIQGVVVSSQLADGIVDNLGKFAAALRPVPMLSAAPSLPNANNPAGSYFYNTTTTHFYQVTADGAGYTDVGTDPDSLAGRMEFYSIGALNAKDITGLILAAQINSITAGQITGSIQASQIGAVNASAISGQITASQIATVGASQITGTITAGQIQSVAANQITGSIQGSQIQSIVANTITVGTLADSQIGTVSGGKIIAGTVTSDKLSSTSIDVGGGSSGKPGVFNVYDSSNNVVGRVGTLSTSDYGGWFKVFGAGGTSYSDAVVKTDVSGNLTITNARITITNPSTNTTIATNPGVYDSTYSSISWDVYGTSDKASLVSRGLVVTNSGAPGNHQVCAIVRDPNYSDAGTVTVLGAGNLNIVLSGHDGVVAALGFKCSGNAGVGTAFYGSDGSNNYRFTVTGGIITSYGSPVHATVTQGPVNLTCSDGGVWSLWFEKGMLSAANKS